MNKKLKKIFNVNDTGFIINKFKMILKYFVKINVEYKCDKEMNGLKTIKIVKKDEKEI